MFEGPRSVYAKANVKLPGLSSWTGGAIDMVAGSAMGSLPGFIVGLALSTATKTTLTCSTFLLTNFAVTATVNALLDRAGCLDVHWDRCTP